MSWCWNLQSLRLSINDQSQTSGQLPITGRYYSVSFGDKTSHFATKRDGFRRNGGWDLCCTHHCSMSSLHRSSIRSSTSMVKNPHSRCQKWPPISRTLPNWYWNRYGIHLAKMWQLSVRGFMRWNGNRSKRLFSSRLVVKVRGSESLTPCLQSKRIRKASNHRYSGTNLVRKASEVNMLDWQIYWHACLFGRPKFSQDISCAIYGISSLTRWPGQFKQI